MRMQSVSSKRQLQSRSTKTETVVESNTNNSIEIVVVSSYHNSVARVDHLTPVTIIALRGLIISHVPTKGPLLVPSDYVPMRVLWRCCEQASEASLIQ